MNAEILTTAEAAEYLRISLHHVRAPASAGKLPATQIGDDWRFMRGQLYDYLSAQAEIEQRRRIDKNIALERARNTGDIQSKRGLPTKSQVQLLLEKHGAQYGG